MAMKLMTVSEIAHELDVTYQTVHMWTKKTNDIGFPKPVHSYKLPSGGTHLVFSADAVSAWHKSYVPKKGGAPVGNTNAMKAVAA
jgi:hypothetical protein